LDKKGFRGRFRTIMERLRIGQVLCCQAAGEHQTIGYTTLERLIDAEEKVNQGGEVK